MYKHCLRKDLHIFKIIYELLFKRNPNYIFLSVSIRRHISTFRFFTNFGDFSRNLLNLYWIWTFYMKSGDFLRNFETSYEFWRFWWNLENLYNICNGFLEYQHENENYSSKGRAAYEVSATIIRISKPKRQKT